MKPLLHTLGLLLSDLASTIVFLVVMMIANDFALATIASILVGVAQVV